MRVRAAGVNPVDFKSREGKGASSNMGGFPLTVGWDVCGEVTKVGGGVTRFEVGDEVFGMPWFPREAGAYAELVTAPSRHFERKPHALSVEEAGALPLAGLTAWQIVVDTLRVQEGDDVLIHGGAGGVGHLAVQVAAARGANVFATARREQADFLAGPRGGADARLPRRRLRLAAVGTRLGDRLHRPLRRALAGGDAPGRDAGLGAERGRSRSCTSSPRPNTSGRPGSWSSPTRSAWPGCAT